MEILHLLKVNIFSFTVLMGTFALAMSFAGNDLVNFIGVPLAGLDSYQDFHANGGGASPDSFMMTSLMSSAKTPPLYLMAAGVIMIIAMATSKKARNVIKTSVDLARQDEGDEMFGSNRAARAIVRSSQSFIESVAHLFPVSVRQWVNSRFNSEDVELTDDKAALRCRSCCCQPRGGINAYHLRYQPRTAPFDDLCDVHGGYGFESCRPCVEP